MFKWNGNPRWHLRLLNSLLPVSCFWNFFFLFKFVILDLLSVLNSICFCLPLSWLLWGNIAQHFIFTIHSLKMTIQIKIQGHIKSFGRCLVVDEYSFWTNFKMEVVQYPLNIKNAKLIAQNSASLTHLLTYALWPQKFSSQYSCCDNLPDQNKANTLHFIAVSCAQVASPSNHTRSSITQIL